MSTLHPLQSRSRLGIAALALGLAFSASARAESDNEPGSFQPYFGIGGGASPMTLDSRDYSINGAFVTQMGGITDTVSQDKDYAASFKGFVGLRFLKYFGVEAGYSHFGTVGFTAQGVDVDGGGFHDFTDRGDFSAEMSYVAALLTLPTGSDGSYFHLKGGTAQVKVNVTETITREYLSGLTTESVTKSAMTQTRPLIGIGYTMPTGTGKHNQLRLELEYIGEIGKAYLFGTNDGTGRANVMMFSASYMVAF